MQLDGLSLRQRYLVGVSGGRDSVALLHALHEAGHRKLIVVHVNHSLRGRASAADARFVQRLAARYGYAWETRVVNVAAQAKAQGQSIETAAREARHAVFAEVAALHRCPRVLLAHHADDQAETVLMRVMRGTGLRGLSGMASESKVGRLTLLRPLLHVRRAEIETYACERKLKHREDASNNDVIHTRNRLRHDVLPILGRDAVPALLSLAKIAAREDDCLDQLVNACASDVIAADGRFVLHASYREAHSAVQHRLLHRWLKARGVGDLSSTLIEQAHRLTTHTEPARINLPGALQLRRRAGHLSVVAL